MALRLPGEATGNTSEKYTSEEDDNDFITPQGPSSTERKSLSLMWEHSPNGAVSLRVT